MTVLDDNTKATVGTAERVEREVSLAPRASRGERFASYDVEAFERPGGREEDWRFTPMRRLRGLHDGTAGAADGTPQHRSGEVPDGITVEHVEVTDPRRGSVLVPFDRVSAAAYGLAGNMLAITVAPHAAPAQPAVVRLTGEDAGQVRYGHTFVDVGTCAEATVVLEQTGSVTLADNVEVLVNDGARLTFVTVTDWADDAVQAQHVKFRLGRDATVTHIQVTFGGDLVRQFTSAQFAGPGGDFTGYGLYFADAGQHLEHRLFVDHAVPNCRSRVTYKGALQGDAAHTVWIGDVLIRAAAEGTDTFELNRNLVLTDGARADSVPNLEIETGEIEGAGHASATGRFDDEQLFYLTSRGIPTDQARRLVVRGFFGEILSKITIPDLRDRLEAAVEAELAATDPAGLPTTNDND